MAGIQKFSFTMKNAMIAGFFCLFSLAVSAQQNFFVEENGGMEIPVKQKLLDANQNISHSIVGSDYILKTSYAALSPNEFTVRMTVIDSLTYKTVMEDSEDYVLRREHKKIKPAVWLALEVMMEKNLSKMLEAVEMNRLHASESQLKKGRNRSSQ